MVKSNILEAIGNTPLVKLNKITKDLGRTVLVKVEGLNPSGSIKIRPALNMIEEAERQGVLKKDSVIVEFSSGNQGIGLSLVAAVKGYGCAIIMPDCMSSERIRTIKAYGAEIILTPSYDSITDTFAAAEAKAKELVGSDPKYILAGQFINQANSEAHHKGTGTEIIEQLGDIELDAFVAAIGTGGTISGTGRVLKEKYKDIKVVAVEPDCAAVLLGKEVTSHRQQGIGDGFIPEILEMDVFDEVIEICDDVAFETTRRLAREEGLFVGVSSGTNVAAAIKIAKSLPEGSVVVTILPDNGDRYLSVEDLFI